jgi:tetratricopeptide (TPR) repeat protein
MRVLTTLAIVLIAVPAWAQTPAPLPTPPQPPAATEPKAEAPQKSRAERAEEAALDRREKTDNLLDRLALTRDAREAKLVETMIWKQWVESGSPTGDLLLEYGATALNEKDPEKALALLDALVETTPDFAEGWNKRATLNYYGGRYEQALIDINKALAIEPRHFAALSGRGLVLEALNRKAEALESYRLALAVYPAMEGLKDKVKELTLEVQGQPI